MAILPVFTYPDPRLKLVAEPVQQFDAGLATLCADMKETMYHFDGIGLAAVQVNIPLRIISIDVSPDQNQYLCLINPSIICKSGTVSYEEGCLSFPGIYAKVKRSAEVTVEYYDATGKAHSITADGLLGVCLQHEIDHLNGITFFDHLSSLKQKLLRGKLEKIRDQIS